MILLIEQNPGILTAWFASCVFASGSATREWLYRFGDKNLTNIGGWVVCDDILDSWIMQDHPEFTSTNIDVPVAIFTPRETAEVSNENGELRIWDFKEIIRTRTLRGYRHEVNKLSTTNNLLFDCSYAQFEGRAVRFALPHQD